jgi:hypothetical protein
MVQGAEPGRRRRPEKDAEDSAAAAAFLNALLQRHAAGRVR